MNKLIQKLVLRLEWWCCKKDKMEYIRGTSKEFEDVYLIRYFLFESRFFSIYIHRFLRSDRDDPHDHPFWFLGYCVKGGYTELKYPYNTVTGRFEEYYTYRNQGSLAFRKATDIHMVKLDQEYTLGEFYKAPLTIILRGPRTRPWGFWKNILTEPVWVIWHKYLKEEKEDK